MDVARDGPADAPALLIISSGCHGGGGLLRLGRAETRCWPTPASTPWPARPGVAVLHVHALNPWGFSWLRRTTHENVDLNRNWHDFSQPLPRNAAYDEIAHWLVPATWPPAPQVEAALARYAGRPWRTRAADRHLGRPA